MTVLLRAPQGDTRLGTLSHGDAFNLQVTSFVFLCCNVLMCRHNGLEQSKKQAELRHSNRERLNTTGTVDSMYVVVFLSFLRDGAC